MHARFVIALNATEDVQSRLNSCRAIVSAEAVTFAKPGFDVLVHGEAVQPLGADGLLMGTLFKRGCARPLKLDQNEQAAAVASGGDTLVRQYWGAYVAVIADRDCSTIHVVRAPLGDLPCYWTRVGATLVFATDVALLRAAGADALSIDPPALVRQLAAENLRRPETCLKQVREVPGGTRMSVDQSGIRTIQLWSPWTFTQADRQLRDPAESERRVRDAALHCVRARSAQFGPVLLKLSGGLDSSIVAACLHAAGADFIALNLVTRDPSGDERDHARAVAGPLGVQLIESIREAAEVNLERSAAARLPRPTAYGMAQESARLAAAAAVRAGSVVLFDGGGGDNLFCSIQSARPVADCLLSPDSDGRFWTCARTIAQLAQASITRVAWRAFFISRRRSPSYSWPLDLRFLSNQARAQLREAPDHPWLAAPTGTLPGKAAHVALIAGAQSVVEGFDAEALLPSCSPLIAQPVVEACLTVPSWQWFDRGYNRAIARDAFAGLLPECTVRRRSKGAPDCFIAEIYESNRALIRTMLMDGVLRRLELLDVAALLTTLGNEGPVEGHDYLRIMQLVDAEAWARAWS